MRMPKKIYVIILFILLSNIRCIADATYPKSIELFDFNSGGKLHITDTKDSIPLCYFIKPSWLEEYKSIYYWKGLKRQNAQARSIEYSYILDAITSNNDLLLLLKENNNIITTIFDTSNTNKIYTIIDSNIKISFNTNIHWLKTNNSKLYYLILDKELYKLNIIQNNRLNIKKISNKTLSAHILNNSNKIVFIEESSETGLLYVIDFEEDKFSSKDLITRVNITDNIKIQEIQDYLVIMNSTDKQLSTSLQFVDIKNKNIINSIWLQTAMNYIDFTYNGNYFYSLINERSQLKIIKISLKNLNNSEEWEYTNLPGNIFSAKQLKIIKNDIYIIFENAIVVFNNKLDMILFDYFNFNEYLTTDFDIILKNNYLILSSNNGSLILKIIKHNYWFLARQIKNTGNSIAYILLVSLILIFYRLYRNQKRLLEAILALPSSGFVFVINRSGKLVQTNEDGKIILGITSQTLLKKPFLYYFKDENIKVLSELIEQGLNSRISFQQKVNIIQENISKEWFCSLIPLRNIAGRFRGIVLTGVDITEELEKKILTNWAQLAHDMQTNLSTIRLNAEQLETEENINNKNRKEKIIYQSSILMQRVRDIVTVGRDDNLDKVTVNSKIFCNEARKEFDEVLFNNIKFNLDGVEDFNFICDKPKMLRCVRNAIENGIKSMKNKKGGIITLSCTRDIHNIYISIEDTGIGMDETIKAKLSTPFFSTEKKDGGSGIGMMIIKRVAIIHGGDINVETQKNKGTKITIYFPDILRRKKEYF